MLPHWAEPLWANTLRDNKGGGEGKRRGKAGVEGEDRWRRKSENERGTGKTGAKRSESDEHEGGEGKVG